MKIKNIIAYTLTICIILSIITPAFNYTVQAASNADSTKNEIIKSSSDYLKLSKNSDNSIGYSGLINDTAEAVAVLERFTEEDVSASIDWVNGFKKTNNDENARSIMANKSSDTLSDIFKSQNTDGGFGLTAEYESDVFDSILVLEAINSLGQKDRSNATWRLVTYIARQMNKNGSYSYTKNSDENVALTAMALYTVSKFMHDNSIKSDLTTDMINKSSAYLISKSKNTFDKETIEESIYVDLALQEAGLFELQEEAINALKKVQSNDGSFYGNVHLTSLVIWLLGKMGSVTNVTVYDLKSTNTSQAYYGVDTDINVSYSISYAAKADKDFTVGCSIVNGSETIYESEKEAVKLIKNQSVYSGSFKDIKINQDKDNGIKVIVTLYDGDEVVKKSEGKITMENQPRVGETEITDFTLELSDYYVVAGSSIDVTATYKLLYTTNVENAVDMQVTLSKEGNVLKEETFNEALLPENDSIEREAMTFTPDTTCECKYTVTVKCLYQGEQIMQYTADVYVIVAPSEESDDTHTDTDSTVNNVPFTVSWIGPKLSDYIVYAGKKNNITGDVGVICYGKEEFKGILVTKVKFGDKEIVHDEKEVEITADNMSNEGVSYGDTENASSKEFTDIIGGFKNVTFEDVYDFDANELGEYTVSAELYDSKGEMLQSGYKTVKVLNKKKISLIANSNVSDTEDNTINISWNDISNSDDTFNYRLYRRYDDKDWETLPVWDGNKKIKVLSVYSLAPFLGDWMDKTIEGSDKPAGMGLFDIDSVYIREYNANPEKYIMENGSWKYDVVFFGCADIGIGLSAEGYKYAKEFVDSGRGMLLGHDTLWLKSGNEYFNKFAEPLGVILIPVTRWYASSSVSVIKKGIITNYPWNLSGDLTVPQTHTTGPYVGGNLDATEWITINATKLYDEETGSHTNSYLITNNNIALIQTGHSGGQSDDERKVIANTLFYLNQLSQGTSSKDYGFYDMAKPDEPDVTFIASDKDGFSFNISSEENGTSYQYYIDAVSSIDKDEPDVKSNIMSHMALSGIKGYVYIVNNNPNKDDSILNYDENNEHILNISNANEDGTLDININTTMYDSTNGLYLHVFAIDNEDNVSEEVIKNLGEGNLSPHIETDKAEYYVGDNVKITSLTSVMPFNVTGDVSISLYDSEDKYIEELYGKNNQVVNVDSPYTTEHELALDDSYSGSYKVKIEWTTADAETYSDIAEFSIVIPSNKEDDEKKTDDVHTATDADNSKTDNTNNSKDDTDRTDKDDNNKQNDTTRDNESNSTNVVTNTTEEKQSPSSVSSTQNNPASDKKNKKNSKDKTKKNQPTKKQTESTTEVTTETTTQDTTQSTTDKIHEKPANPSTPSTVKNRTPETGDEVNLILLFAIMGISAIMAVGCLIYKKSSKE